MSYTVLIIEDNPTNMKLCRVLLETAKYHVITSGDAENGINLAKEQHPNLILMDIQLPDMDGVTATKKLKADPALQNIPIIALTALAMKGDQDMILAGGCDDYVGKPLDYKHLLAVIEKHLPKRPADGQP